MRLDIEVLTRVAVRIDGANVTPPGAKARQVLALLALRHGRVVPVPTLTEELWTTRPPASARTIVQTYIHQVRRSLGGEADAPRLLERCGDGYLLDARDIHLDAEAFVQTCEDAATALRRGNDEAAARLAADALKAWSGEPLADVATGPHLGIEHLRLRGAHDLALDTRFQAELRLGNHHAVLGDLAAEVARQPLDERLGAAYAVALYRCGRQAQAFDVLRDLRRRLRDELGVEPSPATRDLQARLLRGELGSAIERRRTA